jgi:hypothetical protein
MASVGVDASSGRMNVGVDTLQNADYDGGNAAGAIAIGSVFHPPKTGLMTVNAVPSITFSYGNDDGFLISTHTHAWMGFYINEHNLDGTFVQTVVDQQINLWDMSSDHDFGGSEGFPFTAHQQVLGDHLYAVWVWAGADAESLRNSFANLKVFLPFIFATLA